jgi:hypothetical protein
MTSGNALNLLEYFCHHLWLVKFLNNKALRLFRPRRGCPLARYLFVLLGRELLRSCGTPFRPPWRGVYSFAWSRGLSSTSPIAIRMTCTALLTTSAGRFSPLGPRGMRALSHKRIGRVQRFSTAPDFKLRHYLLLPEIEHQQRSGKEVA